MIPWFCNSEWKGKCKTMEIKKHWNTRKNKSPRTSQLPAIFSSRIFWAGCGFYTLSNVPLNPSWLPAHTMLFGGELHRAAPSIVQRTTSFQLFWRQSKFLASYITFFSLNQHGMCCFKYCSDRSSSLTLILISLKTQENDFENRINASAEFTNRTLD